MSSNSDRESYLELLEEVVNWLAGLGLITFVIFPLALPLIALTALLAIPVAIGGVLVAILAAPFLLVRRVLRARRETRSGGVRTAQVTENGEHATVVLVGRG